VNHNLTTQYSTTTQTLLSARNVKNTSTTIYTTHAPVKRARTGQQMTKRIITAEVDEQWFEILGQITKHQEGFVWIEVKDE
jgi:hypothetical protein